MSAVQDALNPEQLAKLGFNVSQNDKPAASKNEHESFAAGYSEGDTSNHHMQTDCVICGDVVSETTNKGSATRPLCGFCYEDETEATHMSRHLSRIHKEKNNDHY